MYLDKEEREMYENELKRLRDYIAEMKTAEIRGIEKGMQRGIEKGMEKGEKKKAFEIAQNLLDVLDNETIAIKTDKMN